MIINELVTKFTFKMGRGLAKYESSMRQAQHTGTKATRSIERSWRGLAKRLSKRLQLKISAKNAQRELSSTERMLHRITQAAIGFGAGYVGFSAVSRGIKAVADVGIETENILTRLAAIRGPEQARRDFAQLNQFAAQTPFQFAEVATAFQRLNAAGFNVDLKSMRKLGDIAAGSGKSLKELADTMISAGRGQAAMIDNFNGLAGAAKSGKLELSAYDSATGKLEKTLVDAGNKAALLDFFLRAGERNDTAGQMEKLSKTLGGLSSTLKDNVAAAMRSVFLAGFGDLLKSLVISSTKLVQAMTPLARSMVVAFSLKIKNNADGISSALARMAGVLKLASAAAAVFAAHWVGFQALRVAGLIQGVVVAIRSMTIAELAAAAAGGLMNAAVLLIPTLIGAAIVAVGALAFDFYKFFTTGNSMLLDFTSRWPWLKSAIQNVYTFIVAFGIGVGKIFSGLGQKWANTINLIKSSVAGLGSLIISAFQNAVNGAVSAFASLPSRLAAVFARVRQIAANALSSIKLPGFNLGGIVPGFSSGGIVPGGFGTRDTVPAMLTPGELVVPVPTVRKLMQNPAEGIRGIQALLGRRESGSVTAPSPTYTMPGNTIAGNAGGVVINAPIRQQITISSPGQGDIIARAREAGNRVSDGISNGLSNAAKQVPRRVGA